MFVTAQTTGVRISLAHRSGISGGAASMDYGVTASAQACYCGRLLLLCISWLFVLRPCGLDLMSLLPVLLNSFELAVDSLHLGRQSFGNSAKI